MIFEETFREKDGKPFMYKGDQVFLADELQISKKFSGYIQLISTDSEWKQAVCIAVNGEIEIDSVKIKKHVRIWQEHFVEALHFSGTSKDGKLYIWNVWNNGRTVESWRMGAAMKKETNGNEIIYYCNDGHPDDDFTDLTFKLVLD